MGKRVSVVADIGTVVISLCAVALVGKAYLFRGGGGETPHGRVEREIEDWERLAVGHRMGPGDASLVIIEWSDYQCPVCKWFHSQVEAVRAAHPADVTLVYRHWPLGGHVQAYPAARAAECAAVQGVFREYHDLLFGEIDWEQPPFVQIAEAAGVGDIDSFEACLGSEHPVDRIEQDIAVVKDLGGLGTPTIIVNGLLLANTPDSTELKEMPHAALPEG
jgi:protein-disulfide isomerase